MFGFEEPDFRKQISVEVHLVVIFVSHCHLTGFEDASISASTRALLSAGICASGQHRKSASQPPAPNLAHALPKIGFTQGKFL